jgi:Skp family chaperone for outer membrane proteins
MHVRTMQAIVFSIAASIFVAGYAHAADNKAPTLGFVDVQKVFYECEEAKKSTADLRAEGEKLQAQLQRMLERRLLTDDQRKEAETIDAIDKPTDAQKQRLAELTAEAKKYEDELKDLQQKPESSLDDKQKERLNELTTRGRQATQKIQELNDTYAKQLNDKNQDMSTKIQEKIKNAIADVAKAKGLNAVVDKQVILYGGLDITDDVMKIVNKQ